MDMPVEDNRPEQARNVLGEPMEMCCEKPLTGFYRNGRCDTGPLMIWEFIPCVSVLRQSF